MTVITRFAPSPTGYFHAGSYRTALFSYIFARKNLGRFVLRIEDTDKERSKKEYEENIIDSLKWLGLEYDEFYRQSERLNVYKQYIQKLIDSDHAYVSIEPTEQGSSDKKVLNKSVIRFKNPNKRVAFDDLIRGRIEFDTTELGDFVIAKNMEEPVFHLVNVVDDIEMKITHVIRGEDHISNTPRQILIYEALGAKLPLYAHIPLLLATDRSKLSKRNGAISITEYRTKGVIKEALVNYLALLGWHPSDDREILSFDDIIKEFSLDRVQKGGAIFDEQKLFWFNRQYITKLSYEDFLTHSKPFIPEWLASGSEVFKRIIPILKDKITLFSEISTILKKGGELAFVRELSPYNKAMLVWKTSNSNSALLNLEHTKALLEKISDDDFGVDNIKNTIWPYALEKGKGDVLWPMRVALTGQEKSPDPFVSAYMLGKAESLSRIDKAILMLKTDI